MPVLPPRSSFALVPSLAGALLIGALAAPASGQGSSSGPQVRQLSTPQPGLALPGSGLGQPGGTQAVGARRAILLTGYWPPSNEAVRRFSTSATQNPEGWIGSNWENRGYDVYSYFPQFANPNCTNCGSGTGDMMVDYQDTSTDFWAFANALQPIAIITFSRTNPPLSWELEMNSYNFASWTNDYIDPRQPTPAPPDASVPAETLRTSTLPMQEIVDDIVDANLGLNSFICFSANAGGFVSGFAAYHGSWYQSLHSSPAAPDWCVAAGHIHVGPNIPFATARRAAEVSVRTLIRHVDTARFGCIDVDSYCATTSNSAGPGAMLTTSGTTSISANGLRFIVTGMPPNQAGTLFYGLNQTSTPWGNGTLCVAGPQQRLGPILNASPSGFLDRTTNFTLPPLGAGANQVLAGSTWNFQYTYRDPASGGTNFDSTNGLRITFCP